MIKLPKIKLMDFTDPSESFLLAVILAAAGGFLDGYTYIGRGNVFANTQTGNLILLGVNMARGRLAASISYIVPVTAFLLGTYITEKIRIRYGGLKHLGWRQIVVALEALVLILISFMPHYSDNVANAMVSFACAMQFNAFRTMNGVPFSSTLSMTNMRGAIEYIDELPGGLRHRKKSHAALNISSRCSSSPSPFSSAHGSPTNTTTARCSFRPSCCSSERLSCSLRKETKRLRHNRSRLSLLFSADGG